MLIVKKFVCLITIVYLVDGVEGDDERLTCYRCNQYGFRDSPNSDNRCYFPQNNSLPNEVTCAQDSATEKYYCRTQFRWEKDILYQVDRDCISSLSDEDASTNEVPDSVKCDTSNDWRRTYCYYHCRTKNCNNLTVGDYKRCNSTCGGNQKGRCDVISGECICAIGWKGQDCLLPAISTKTETRRCVQCTSETDELCHVKNESTACFSDQAFCSFTEILNFDQGRTRISRLVAKGCSPTAGTSDGCKLDLDGSYRGRWRYACHRTCAEDGCNADLDFSSIETSDRVLRCYQCNRIGNCYGSAKSCSLNSTHCQSTTSYVYNSDVLNPDASSYLTLETYRGCTTAAIPTQCIDEEFGFNLTKTTCWKTCAETGCNPGWSSFKRCESTCGKDLQKGQCDVTIGECICAPGWTGQDCSEISSNNESRRCVQCASERDELCIVKSETSACPSHHAFCYFTEINTFAQGHKLISRLVTKGCSSAAVTFTGCKMNLDYNNRGRWTYTCHRTCPEDGCNSDLDFSSVEISDTTLRCVQCSGIGRCYGSTRPCSPISTHCQSTTSYVFDKNELNPEWSSHLVLETYRGCATAAIPTQCIDEDLGFNLTKTTCKKTCEENGCNTDRGSFKRCTSTCGKDLQKGQCDVTRGECICASGWTGQDCSEISTNIESRRCVQCTTERDELCEIENKTSACLSNEAFCYFTEIHTFTQGHKLISRLVTKGCSSAAVTFTGCKINLDYNNRGRWTYTCHRTCPEDGCNANLDFSSVEISDTTLRCVQCSGIGSCYGSTRPCSPISTHCQSTTSYVFDKNELNPEWSSHWVLETYRGCATAAIPTQCIDEDLGFNVTKTTCQKTCEENGCNSDRGSFKRCTSMCGKDFQKGQCDVTSGECICASGWTGQDCSEISTNNELRRCVQCTSKRDELCEIENETSACLSNEAFCYFTEIHTFSQGYKRISRIVAKGCSSAEVTYNGCKMNRDYSNRERWIYTCHRTCAEDGCNANLDFSSAEASDTTLRCVQCSGIGNCHGTSRPCSPISTHCQSTTSYVHDNNVLNPVISDWSSYMVVETFRGCAYATIPTQCIDEDLGFNLTKTTCQETCEGNGCNQDWPARPKCVQCSASYKDYYMGNCLTVFPIALPCPYPQQTHCTTKHTIGKFGDTSVIERGCGTHSIENGCYTDTVNNVTREICTEACTTDACNTGYVGPKEDLNRAVLAVSYYSP